MCTGLEGALIPLLLGGVTSAVGGAMSSSEANANAQRESDARNRVLTDTLTRNNTLSQDARSSYATRETQIQPDAMTQQQGQATDSRLAALTSNMPQINSTTMPGAADAPTIVKTAISKALTDALDKSTAKANAQAQLGGYGDLFFNQGLADANANRGITTDANFAQSNNSLITPLQDLAATSAYQPVSPLGGVLQGVGSTIGSAAGAGKLTNASFGL